MEIEYIGEHLVFGKVGNLLIAIAFVSALLSAVGYFLAARHNSNALTSLSEKNSWLRMGRLFFLMHAISIFGVIGLIFFLIHGHYFEYHYVWQHSSTIMPMKYIWACFWEGQEGSFLLWMFWHVMLAFVIMRVAGKWEYNVMWVVALVQVFLVSMILGTIVLGHKIGTNPFLLLREHPDMAGLPFIQLPDYLSRIMDGRGLNPLLQNYWMVIHPPVLFLGFASTLIPFAYAIGGMMDKKLGEWVKPALPWAFFSVMVFGTGILMGAAWAYEALSFGGFWAWDPVENASLVPWITMVGAAHLMLIYKNRQQFLATTFILTIISFILVLYSTFLTRSGILGETSVHAFTDLGMTGQLVIYMLFFLVLAGFLLATNWKNIPKGEKEENLFSREFWMFIGVLVLLISAFQIAFSTSTPVINKLFGTNLAPPIDAISHYNSWQVPIAIIICLLIAVAQFLKYKITDPRALFKSLVGSFLVAIGITVLFIYILGGMHPNHAALLFASLWAFIANTDYLVRKLKGKMRLAGSSIAHAGIALILLGALVSNGKQEIISRNVTNINLGEDFPNNENILLRIGDTLSMGKYFLTYTGSTKEGVNIIYNIEYYTLDPSSGELVKSFILNPIVQTNPRMGNVSEPATKRFLTRDIYTHVTYAEIEKPTEAESDQEYSEPVVRTMGIGDTVSTSSCLIILNALNTNVDRTKFDLGEGDLAVGGQLTVIDRVMNRYSAEPIFVIKNRMVFSKEAIINETGLKIGFNKIDPATGKVDLVVSEKKESKKDFIIMKAIVFPYINILWIGCLLMILGTTLAIRHNIITSRKKTPTS